jgi:hypothetical protein
MKLPSLKQPTTQRGLVAMFTLLASSYAPEHKTEIIDIGVLVYAWLLILVDEENVNSRRT